MPRDPAGRAAPGPLVLRLIAALLDALSFAERVAPATWRSRLAAAARILHTLVR